jgi:MFS family permease
MQRRGRVAPRASADAAMIAESPVAQQMKAASSAGRNEWLLVTFTALTNMADVITRVALPALAVSLTSSPGLVALVGVLESLPWLVVTRHVGALVDRTDRRLLMVTAEITRLTSVGVVLRRVRRH